MSRTILLTGVTGHQGSAVLTALHSHPDFPTLSVRAIARDPTKATHKLGSLATEIQFHKANLYEKSTLVPALTGVDTAFLMTVPDPNIESEIKQGKTFVDAAKETGVGYIVYSSVGSVERNTGVPHWETKRAVEEYIIESGIPHTFIRPVQFMDNFPVEGGMGRFMMLGLFRAALREKKIQVVAVKDIGEFVAKAILEPEAWKGREVELAGDEVSMKEMLDIYQKVQGARPWTAWFPAFALKVMLPSDLPTMFKWFHDDGFKANIAERKQEHPGLLNFEEYLRDKSKTKSA